MKSLTKFLLRPFLLLSLFFLFFSAKGQSVLDPNDPVITHNRYAPPGSSTNPYPPSTMGVIGKWIRTVRVNWNTEHWKCYIYNGVPFRLRFPQSYDPAANDGKRYPILVFWHGRGEAGVQTDNEYQLKHGMRFFERAMENGMFDGYVICMQSTDSWGPNHNIYMSQILDYMVANNKLDPFRICVNGLSSGGYNSWGFMEMFPGYTATALPMSGISLYDEDPIKIDNYKFTPIWYFQGGLDGSPAQYTADIVAGALARAGSNFKYQVFSTLAHHTWDSAWAQPDFIPWLNRAYMANPRALYDRTRFSPGDSINVAIGVAPMLDEYQWRKDGEILSGATGNTITATQTGTYDCRVRKGTIWSEWSHVPVVVQLNPILSDVNLVRHDPPSDPRLHALTAYPNPFDQYFILAVPASDNEQIVVTVNDPNGRLLYMKRFEGLYAGINYLRIQPDQPLPTGVCFVTITNHRGGRKTIRVVRK